MQFINALNDNLDTIELVYKDSRDNLHYLPLSELDMHPLMDPFTKEPMSVYGYYNRS